MKCFNFLLYFFQTLTLLCVRIEVVRILKSAAVPFFQSFYACQLNKRNSIISNDNFKISLTMTVSFVSVYQENQKNKYFLHCNFDERIVDFIVPKIGYSGS